MGKNNFKTLSTKELQTVNGGQEVPIIIHTYGHLTEYQMQQIRNRYPSGTIIEFVY